MTTNTSDNNIIEKIQKFPFILAPLAGYSDYPFRILCKEYGASLLFTEMINVHSLVNPKVRKKINKFLYYTPEERPIGIQLFGNNPDMFFEAAKISKDLGYDVIDINFGCPVRKVVHSKSGAYLMTEPLLAGQIISKTVEAAGDMPVSIKIRSGWDENSINYLEFNRIAEGNGVKIITLHSRTRAQGFSGVANRQHIAELKRNSSLFVIGNGDVIDAESAGRMQKETGCDAVMIGRGAIGNPFIFKAIKDKDFSPQLQDRIKISLKHFDLMIEFEGKKAVFKMRKFFTKYIKDFDDAARIRRELFTMEDIDKIREYLNNLKLQVSKA